MSMLGETVNDGWVVTKRNLLKIKRIPDLLIFATDQFRHLIAPRRSGTIPGDGLVARTGR